MSDKIPMKINDTEGELHKSLCHANLTQFMMFIFRDFSIKNCLGISKFTSV